MKRRAVFIAILIGVPIVACLGSIILVLAASNNDDRASFQALDATAIANFAEEHRLASEQGEAWAQEPQAVALHFTCYEECGGEGVTASTPEPDRVVVIVEDHNVFDDSIKATMERYEFVRSGNEWVIDWIGWKQQCRRDDWTAIFQGRFGWHIQPCP